MSFLFIDSNPVRYVRFIHKQVDGIVSNNPEDCITILSDGGHWDYLSMEYHLGEPDDDVTADPLIEWMLDNEPSVSMVILHTLDAGKAYEMICRLNRKYVVKWIPFDSLEQQLPIGSLTKR